MPAPREPEPITPPPVLTESQLRARRWAANGGTFGFILGAVMGMLIAGPRFSEWSAIQSSVVVIGGALVGMALGYLAMSVAIAGQAAAPAVGGGDRESGGDGGSGDGGSGDSE